MYVLCVHNSDDILNARKSLNAFCLLAVFAGALGSVVTFHFYQSIETRMKKATHKNAIWKNSDGMGEREESE